MRIGIDLGGTKIEAAALDQSGKLLLRHRVTTPPSDYQGTLDAICQLIDKVENELGTRGTLGMGTPGAISPATGLIKNANSVWLNGQALHHDLERQLGRPVRITNDANCFALSEATDGAAAGADIVFGVIVGTGTGAGIVVKGQVVRGANAIAGEWGHNPLPWPRDEERPGVACWCGRRGCIESWLSGPGMARDHGATTGEYIAAPEIVRRAANADEDARATVQRYEGRMARALAHVINLLDPDVIVLGGGMSNIARLYETVPALWGDYVFSDKVTTRLVAPQYGDSSGVRGAAWLWNL